MPDSPSVLSSPPIERPDDEQERLGVNEGSDIRMLIVDDDPQIGDALELFFESSGYEISRAATGEAALEQMKAQSFDIVLLDVMLPEMDGFAVLEASQELGLVSPVLMISGRGEQEAKLRGFGLGAADYMVKPFEPEELAARVKAILGRSMAPSEAPMDVYQIGDVTINFSTSEARRGEQLIELSEVEFDLLHHLVQNRDTLMTRKRLMREALGIDEETVTFEVDQETVARTLDRHITALRTKLESNPYDPRYIKTVYGLGYRFTS